MTIRRLRSERPFAFALPVVFCLAAMAASPASADSGVHGRVLGLEDDEQRSFIGVIPGAEITFEGQSGSAVGQTTTDANGYYRYSLAPGKWFYTVRAEGFADEDAGRGVLLVLSDRFAVYNISLVKGKSDSQREPRSLPPVETGKLLGRVLEKTPQGVAGIADAVVMLRKTGTRRLERVTASGPGEAGAGQFAVVLEEGTWNASVRAPGFRRFVDPEPIEIVANQDTERDFVLTRDRLEDTAESGIQGAITLLGPDKPTGPPPDVVLSFLRLPGKESVAQQTVSDWGRDEVSGKYRQPLAAGSYRVLASAEGYRSAKSTPAPVFADRYTRVDLKLWPRPAESLLKVEVFELVDKTEYVPIPEATVACAAMEPEGPGDEPMRKTTGDEGLAEFPLPLAAGPYRLSATRDGFREARPHDVDLGPDSPRHFRFVLTRVTPSEELPPLPVNVLVDVFDAAGAPLKDVDVMLQQPKPLGEDRRNTTDADGRATFTTIPGPHAAVARMDGYESGAAKFDVVRGDENRIKIVLKKLAATVPLLVNVLATKTKTPLRGAAVLVRRAGQSVREALRGETDAKGQVSFDTTPGTHDALAQLEGYRPSGIKINVVAGSENAGNIYLEKLSKPTPPPPRAAQTVEVTGYVVYRDSGSRTGLRGVEGATTVWQRLGSGTQVARQARSASVGRYVVENLPEGRYRVTVTLPASSRSSLVAPKVPQEVDVAVGMKPVYLYVTRAARPEATDTHTQPDKERLVEVTIEVRNAKTRARITAANVVWQRRDQPGKGSAQRYRDGTFRSTLPEGTYVFGGSASGHTIASQQKTINRSLRRPVMVTLYAQATPARPDDVKPPVEVTSPTMVPLTVRVLASGKPAVGKTVMALDDAGKPVATAKTNAAGIANLRATVVFRRGASVTLHVKASGDGITPGGTTVKLSRGRSPGPITIQVRRLSSPRSK